jgi:hypothetical protein
MQETLERKMAAIREKGDGPICMMRLGIDPLGFSEEFFSQSDISMATQKEVAKPWLRRSMSCSWTWDTKAQGFNMELFCVLGLPT